MAVQKRLLLMAFALWGNQLAYDPLYLANRAKEPKKIVPTSGTIQDEVAIASLSLV